MSHKVRETIKTLILLILFLTTILFLYLLWPEGSNSFSLFNSSSIDDETESQAYELYDLICPEEILLKDNDGKISYIVSKQLVFERAIEQIKTMCAENESVIVTISPEVYEEARDNFQSLSMKFSYDLNFLELANYAGFKIGSNFDLVQSFDTITYSSAYKSSVFLYSSKSGACFRFAGRNFYFSMDDLLADVETDGYEYIQAKKIMGLGENYIPYAVDKKIKTASVTSKVLSDAESESLARILLGKTFDFARKVVDTVGNTTYMYGYGQKVLKIYKTGELEYKEELSQNKTHTVIEDIAVAKELVDALSLENINGLQFGLSKITDEKDTTGIRRFEYAQYKNGLKVENLSENAAIVIEIENGQIVNFDQNALTVVNEYDNQSSSIYEPARMLAENCQNIYQTVFGNTAKKLDDAYTYVCENVESVELKLVLENSRITAKWLVKIGDKNIYYNYY